MVVEKEGREEWKMLKNQQDNKLLNISLYPGIPLGAIISFSICFSQKSSK